MKIVEIKKQPTWTDMIIGLAIGESFAALHKEYASTIRPLISRISGYIHPERVYSTKKESINGILYLVISREEDKVLYPQIA